MKKSTYRAIHCISASTRWEEKTQQILDGLVGGDEQAVEMYRDRHRIQENKINQFECSLSGLDSNKIILIISFTTEQH